MIPRRVRLAVLLAFLLNGVLILTARYQLSYDAYTHMLLADHYRLNWFSLWDARWYTGFTLSSYPPLVHQLMALAGQFVGVDAGFAAVLWAVALAFPLAVYVFSRVFVSEGAAAAASLGASVLPSFYLSAYAFGQLPTLFALVCALFAAAALAEFLRGGSRLSAALAVALCAMLVGAHHATLLLLPWLVLAIVLHLLLNRQLDLKRLILRLSVFTLLAGLAGLLVIWPFWQWGLGQAMQTPIDHPSRHNYLADPLAALVFFWPMYGPLVALIPYALWQGRRKSFLGLSLAFLCLFLLGLGGTTPLPRLLFGAGWEWLTYDRFALWASVLLLPFLGNLLANARPVGFKWMRWLRRPPFFERLAAAFHPSWAALALFPLLALVSLVASLYPTYLPTQPPPLDMQPILNFLAQDGRSQWRYLTFGFGDQFAYLNRLTTATTIDGSYHTARTLPELRSSGIGQIDTAYWLPGGMAALGPVLQASAQYGVRWGFLDLAAYAPLLKQEGWQELTTLSNGIQVWENPSASLPPPSNPPPTDPLQAASWGSLPLLSLLLAASLAGLRFYPQRAQKILYGVHGLALGLLPLGLALWVYVPLTRFQVDRIYFTYDNALFFLSDGLALVAVLAWTLGRYFGPAETHPQPMPAGKGAFKLRHWLLALCVLASLSVAWAPDGRMALYLSLHLWLLYALFCSLADRPSTWRLTAIGLGVALALEAGVGLAEAAAQSTAFLAPLGLSWPGSLDASTRGASVVELLNGARWLRVYGTLPHPNILGALALVFLAAPASFYLAAKKPRPWHLVLLCAGLLLLLLTFSRGAWVGAAAAALLVALKVRRLSVRRLLPLGLAGAACLVLVAFPLRQLIFARTLDPASTTEQFSFLSRTWLTGQALQLIALHPLFGGGVGSFIFELARQAPVGYLVEPVHNLLLLVTNDLGLPGILIMAGLGWSILGTMRRVKSPQAILLSAALLGLLVTGMFDHSLWTLAPGRTTLVLVMGHWAGQAALDGA